MLRLMHTLIGTTLVAGSASIFNQWLERAADRRMRRTQNRPLPTGRLGHAETIGIGLVSVLVGLAYLLNTTGRPATFWAACTWLLYVGVYTPLKRRTWCNTVVGAVPGALPVLIGWTGTGAELTLWAVCLFLLVFLWQFPHFMAIAWLYRHQYALAEMRMLTVVDPTGHRAGVQAVAAASSVWIVSLVPAALAISGSPIYVLGSTLLGLGQLVYAARFFRCRDDQTARALLRASLVYLPTQFVLVTLLNLAFI
jgi:protoheme IX farnesyltransferase